MEPYISHIKIAITRIMVDWLIFAVLVADSSYIYIYICIYYSRSHLIYIYIIYSYIYVYIYIYMNVA